MAYTTQYIGSRYVPLFADPAEWDSTRTYEPLTIVMHDGNSYTSRQYVPAGIEITDEKFWALTGNYNAQVEKYRKEVADYKNLADTTEEHLATIYPLDTTPTDGSTKGVTSDGINDAIGTVDSKIDSVNNKVDTIYPLDTTPTDGSTKAPTSGAVYNAIKTVNDSLSKFKDMTKYSFDTYQDAVEASLPVGSSFVTNNFSSNDGYGAAYVVTATQGSNTITYGATNYAIVKDISGFIRPEWFYGSLANETTDDKFTYVLSSGYKKILLIGTYQINGQISIPDGVELIGLNKPDRTDKTTVFNMMGTTSQLAGTGTMIILGIRFEYPNWTYNDTSYQAAILAKNTNSLHVENVSFFGGTVGIVTDHIQKANISHVYGYCNQYMIHTQYQYEISTIDDVVMTPHALDDYIADLEPLFAYAYNNSVCLFIDTRTDWLFCSDVFAFNIYTGLLTNITGGNFNNIGFDGCNEPIHIIRGSNETQLSINNVSLTTFLSGLLANKIAYPGNPLILIDSTSTESGVASNMYVNINNVTIWGFTYRVVKMLGAPSHLSMSNVNIHKSNGTVFTDKAATAPLEYLVSGTSNSYVHVSNVSGSINSLSTLFDGTLYSIDASNISLALVAQNIDPYIAKLTGLQQLALNNTIIRVANDYTPSQKYSPITIPSYSRLMGFGNQLAGISQSLIEISHDSTNVLLFNFNNYWYKINISEITS